MAFIEIESIEKTYGSGSKGVDAIRGITLKIERGEFIVILGKSGSGKSTLLSLLAGLEKPSIGSVRFHGYNLNELDEDGLALFRRKEIGMVFQHFYLMEAMTALDNVQLPLIISGEKKNKREPWAKELLKIVGMGHRMSHFPNELSGGERQRVGIARALANRSSVIIADEPTGDLDSKKGGEIINLLYSLNKGEFISEFYRWNSTLIMVTHDVSILKSGMRVIMLSDGQVVQDEIFDGNYSQIDELTCNPKWDL